MRALFGRRNRSNLIRLFAPLVVFVTVVWARAEVVVNIHPWQPLWVLWVLATWIAGAAFGAMAMDVWRSRHR